MLDHLTLATVMAALRQLSLVLSMAMVLWWAPSFMRVIRGRDQGGDGARAIWVTLAASVFLFQVRWLAPEIDDLSRMRIWVVAQAAMTGTQLAAIYHHGAGEPSFNPRRTIVVHLAMVVLCVAFASVTE